MTSPFTEWYPYWVNLMIGSNLNVQDPIYESTSSNFQTVSALAWRHGNQHKILLVSKTDATVSVSLNGLNLDENQEITALRIDHDTAGIETEVIGYSENPTIIVDGYSVILLSLT